MTMTIPLPDIFGRYSKSTLVFPILIWSYVVFYSKNLYYLLPLGIYTICFLSYICWFEKRFIKKEKPKEIIRENIFIYTVIIPLNAFYVFSLLFAFLVLDVLNDIIGFFLIILAILGFIYIWIQGLIFSKPHIKKSLFMGEVIAKTSKEIVRNNKGKLNLKEAKEKMKEGIEKGLKEIKK